jgi:hypothetical protein
VGSARLPFVPSDDAGRADWRDRARCRLPEFDPEWWFPDHGQTRLRAMAVAECLRCPVRLECRTAGEAGEGYGVWGGRDFTEERRSR